MTFPAEIEFLFPIPVIEKNALKLLFRAPKKFFHRQFKGKLVDTYFLRIRSVMLTKNLELTFQEQYDIVISHLFRCTGIKLLYFE